ncbi:MAG TPA: FAD-binding protein, partial [Candidatus Hydrogenedentes bacterium]|nr:FAD-binding protein [Candidatus Hydrogenedentota bacterium]
MDIDRKCDAVARASGCEVRRDALTRALYATDASVYRVEPAAVAFPRSAAETAALARAAAEAGMPLTARGAGSGLAGGALGGGIVADLARHNRAILGYSAEEGTVAVQAGVVLYQLNAFLQPMGV